MTTIEKISFAVFAAVWLIIILGTIGWVMNAIKLAKLDFEEPYKAEIIRGIGLVLIVGAFTGYIDIED